MSIFALPQAPQVPCVSVAHSVFDGTHYKVFQKPQLPARPQHCAMVERACKGVVTQRTPRGMQEIEWRNGLRKFAQSKE